MRIPLDYYRILGLPLAASEEQLRQAYSDRIVQLPRREYSIAAISSRKQLIEEAYVVLSNPKERSTYDQAYLAHSYYPHQSGGTSLLENSAETTKNNQDIPSLSIEIAPEELVGALLLLQELGEYELVLKLGRPYLVNKNRPVGAKVGSHLTREEFLTSPELPDIILTVALACLELGREQWQQGNYENAAISLETGEELLMREGIFTSVQSEIAADLSKLRPYRILELLALPQEKTQERRQGLELLQTILEERGGIDGTGNDQSGLNIDDFLRFIQQLRNYLTVAEQHKLFESESKRPSAVAKYLAVYALIARGFTQFQPALIRQAKQMLIHLGKRQDVHLEQSLCALLLGQTEEATRVLELSQEYEALAIIRERSQDSPDLLPGLCLYCEQWLQQEVFPHFRDLVRKQASLKDYFANRQVQAYLEALPTEPQTTNEWGVINHQGFPAAQINNPRYHNYENANSDNLNYYTGDPELTSSGSQEIPESTDASPSRWNNSLQNNWNQTSAMPGTNSQPEAMVSEDYQQINSKNHQDVQNYHQKRRQRRPVGSNRDHVWTSHHEDRRKRTFANSLEAKTRLVWLVFLGMGSLLVLWLLISTAWGWLNNLLVPKANLQGTPLAIEVNQPPISIPIPNSKRTVFADKLTKAIAQEVIENWLASKAAALGQNHDIDRLDDILIGPVISKWQGIVKNDIANKRHRKYAHDVQVRFVNQNPNFPVHAVVGATVKEVTYFYEQNQIQKTSQERLRVRYNLVRKQGFWRIRGMKIVQALDG